MYTDTASFRAYLEDQIATIQKQKKAAEQRIAILQATINGLAYAEQAYTDARDQLEREPKPTIKALFEEINRRQAELQEEPPAARPLASEEEALAAAKNLIDQERPARLHRTITQLGGIDTADSGFFGVPPAGWPDRIHNQEEPT